ncbi:LuxR C-terminal-related transcriptional regulator [Paucibacter sp. TC2R-5]|uniref:helix-turn-helix transcriptional regulator n=1 Tax=Paucibacter sp. TC2R-5 TaxID=2893555 RepID=UPI0021E3951D|nr:LuxR C-terminal-related transcriptional regulator [Paucibacter sp. TC2R-5]MCV2360138.1 LuxR C-terminal-related transcriptional regulator [Paucibacter sp. TC2R-5]
MNRAGNTSSGLDISDGIAQMYRAARDPQVADFRAWALAHCRQWVDFHSASWVSGCMRDGRPLFHEVYTEGLKAGYWECFLTLADGDPLGPRMFASPGHSFLTSTADFPALMVERWMKVFDVASAISGMAADQATGVYSVVCWHRDAAMPALTERHRQLHQHLLPHWVECLNIHRLTSALRELSNHALPGHQLALVDASGQLHFAQNGVMQLLAREFGAAQGGAFPDALMSALRSDISRFTGSQIVAARKLTTSGLWFVQLREKSDMDSLTPRELEICGLLCQGLTVKTAARQIQVAPSTVDNLRSLAYRKLGVRNRTELARAMASKA